MGNDLKEEMLFITIVKKLPCRIKTRDGDIYVVTDIWKMSASGHIFANVKEKTGALTLRSLHITEILD